MWVYLSSVSYLLLLLHIFMLLSYAPLLPNLPTHFPSVSDDVKSFDNTLEVDLPFPNISVQGHTLQIQ